MIKKLLFALFSLCSIGIFSTQAHSALVERLGGLAYYDDVADLTWLANANLAGEMTWDDAVIWAANLEVAGVSGWRLPETLQPDATCDIQISGISLGNNCTGSEMGNMFYNVLGGVAGSSIATTHNANFDLFSNIISTGYWSATTYSLDNAFAWGFGFDFGDQDFDPKDEGSFAWAVHSGDVSPIPVPATVWLFGTALLGLVGLNKRKRFV